MQYSIINFSKLEKIALRFDSEYYHPYNLKLYSKLLSINHKKIDEFAYVTDGIHESIQFDLEGEVNLISAKAPKENYFDLSGCGKISKALDEKNQRTKLKENDIIVSTVGTIGNCAVVNKTIIPANSDRHVGIIRIQKNFYPRFISSFLLSKYGRFQTLRESTGNVQLNLFIYKIKEILVPKLSYAFQHLIEIICLIADKCFKDANNTYFKAEQLLLSELGLVNWKPKHQRTFNKNFSDTQKAERIDAEYFQPKYEETINIVTEYRNGSNLLSDVVEINDKNFNPSRDNLYKYIELSNISTNGSITGCTSALGNELPNRARRKVNTGDVIVSSIEGSLSSIALINEEYNNSLCSTGFYIINSGILNSETLLVLLKSVVCQLQLKKGCSGTILTAINKDEFSKIILPIVSETTQLEIQEQIKEMYKNKSLSNNLLEIAKRGVEIAIEENEKIAKKLILKKVYELFNLNILKQKKYDFNSFEELHKFCNYSIELFNNCKYIANKHDKTTFKLIVEWFDLSKLILNKYDNFEIGFPLTIIKSESPDFIINYKEHKIGIEHTIGQTQKHAYVTHKLLDSEPGSLLEIIPELSEQGRPKKNEFDYLIKNKNEKLDQSPAYGNALENQWANVMFNCIENKTKKLNHNYNIQNQNILLISENTFPTANKSIKLNYLKNQNKEFVKKNEFRFYFNNIYIIANKWIEKINLG